VFIDGNGVLEPLVEAAHANDLTIAAVLLTHHHGDHLAGLQALADDGVQLPVGEDGPAGPATT
jgi:glyoxylase-like metal-dependent hydrolase (beta-lactamase superfamily II)